MANLFESVMGKPPPGALNDVSNSSGNMFASVMGRAPSTPSITPPINQDAVDKANTSTPDVNPIIGAATSVGNWFTGLAKGLYNQFATPAPEEQTVEKSLTGPSASVNAALMGHPLLQAGAAAVQDLGTAPVKAYLRFVEPMYRPYAEDLGQTIGGQQIVNQMNQGLISQEQGGKVLNDLAVVNKTAPQIIGDTMSAVLGVLSPEAAGKVFGIGQEAAAAGAAEAGAAQAEKGIVSRAITGAAAGVKAITPVGIGFGAAGDLQSGSTDPKVLASIMGQNLAGAWALGGLTGAFGAAAGGKVTIDKALEQAIAVRDQVKSPEIKAVLDSTIKSLEDRKAGTVPMDDTKLTAAATPEGQVPKGTSINLGDKNFQLTGAAEKKYLTELTRSRENISNTAKISGADKVGAVARAEGFKMAALKRDLTGQYTPTELNDKISYERSNYNGKQVVVDMKGRAVNGEVQGTPAYGKFRVKLTDGSIVSRTADAIRDPRSNSEIMDKITSRTDALPKVKNPVGAPQGDAVGTTAKAPEAKAPEKTPVKTEKGVPPDNKVVEGKVDALAKSGALTIADKDGQPATYKGSNATYSVWERKDNGSSFVVPHDQMVARPEFKAAETAAPDTTNKETPSPVGQKIQSKIGKSIEMKAIEDKLTKGFGSTAEVDKVNVKEQAKQATELVTSNLDDARAIIRGEKPLPGDLRGISLITAMEEHIKQNPSGDLAEELANSPLVQDTSRAAQELRLAAERTPDSATARLKEIKKTLVESAGGDESVVRQRKTYVAGLKDSQARVTLPKEELSWDNFLNSIKC